MKAILALGVTLALLLLCGAAAEVPDPGLAPASGDGFENGDTITPPH